MARMISYEKVMHNVRAYSYECPRNVHGHGFYSRWKMLYFKIVSVLKCVLIAFLARNVHFIFIIFTQ